MRRTFQLFIPLSSSPSGITNRDVSPAAGPILGLRSCAPTHPVRPVTPPRAVTPRSLEPPDDRDQTQPHAVGEHPFARRGGPYCDALRRGGALFPHVARQREIARCSLC